MAFPPLDPTTTVPGPGEDMPLPPTYPVPGIPDPDEVPTPPMPGGDDPLDTPPKGPPDDPLLDWVAHASLGLAVPSASSSGGFTGF